MEYTFWVFYSVPNNLPDLYFQVVDEETRMQIRNPLLFVNSEHHAHLQSESGEKLPYFLTLKEHPVLPGRVVFYLHECQLPEVIASGNALVQWMSIVLPTVFKIEIVTLQFMKRLGQIE